MTSAAAWRPAGGGQTLHLRAIAGPGVQDNSPSHERHARLPALSDDEGQHGRRESYEARPASQTAVPSNIPEHPIPSMQEAFAESLEEVTNPSAVPKPRFRTGTAEERRERLLDEDKAKGPPKRIWRFRPGQKCHELRKLMAQISFGVYLLLEGMANSSAQVLAILQMHIDEIDEFVETTLEDVELAINDMEERINFLKLAMENMEMFEKMLENRKFRLQIVQGNIKIEHILSRTSTAHTQTIRDVSEGLRSTKQFAAYLVDHERGEWSRDRPDIAEIVKAMGHNAAGWTIAFENLEASCTQLSGLLVHLSSMVVEMDKKAGEVSRRTRFTIEPYSDPDGSVPSQRPQTPDTPQEATPPPSPPRTVTQAAAPRIQTLYFGSRLSGFLGEKQDQDIIRALALIDDEDASLSSETQSRPPIAEKKRSIMLEEALESTAYTPPESSKTVSVELPLQEDAPLTSPKSEEEMAQEDLEDIGHMFAPDVRVSLEDNALFILQPRVYTPVPPAPPAPLLSPRTAAPPLEGRLSRRVDAQQVPKWDESSSLHQRAPSADDQSPMHQLLETTTYDTPTSSKPNEPLPAIRGSNSLRQRASLRGKLPETLQVPPPPQTLPRPPPVPSLDTMTSSPRSQTRQEQPHNRGSSFGSLKERAAPPSINETGYSLSPPIFAGHLPSPLSDRQYFRPVQASPHSPLQQRPHTAAGGVPRAVPGRGSLLHPRNIPSAAGSSTLSTMESLSSFGADSSRHGSSSGRTLADSTVSGSTRTLKKKKSSAFGWIKKAFALDEEEKAEFEQRKQEQARNLYYEGKSPKFLDGKRIR